MMVILVVILLIVVVFVVAHLTSILLLRNKDNCKTSSTFQLFGKTFTTETSWSSQESNEETALKKKKTNRHADP